MRIGAIALLGASIALAPATAQKGPGAATAPAASSSAIAPPPGASPLVRSFFEICAPALEDVNAGRAAALAHGWSLEGLEAPPMPPGLGSFVALSGGYPDADMSLVHLTESFYPHAMTRMCAMQIHRFGAEAPPVSIPLLDQTPGFEGGFGGAPTGAGAGRWSRDSGDGGWITLDVVMEHGFVAMTLAHLIPAAGS